MLTSLLTSALAAGTASAVPAKPNLILIMTDQQVAGAMSCAGNPWVKTPAMDALAADGVRFTKAYCSFPVSGASRASIITGQIPYVAGVVQNSDRPKKEAMDNGIGHRLSRAGYECLYAGKWHVPEVNIPEEGTGFKKLCNMYDPTLPPAVEKGLKEYDGKKPLFLVASLLDPHEICEYARWESLPYGPVQEVDPSNYPPLPANFKRGADEAEALALEEKYRPRAHDNYSYTAEDYGRYLYAYYRLVERVDAEIGRVVDILKKHNLYDNSVILFCSDHGDGNGAHEWIQKWALMEESINIPLILKAPKGQGLKGTVNDKALTNIGLDIYSTFCDYAGVNLDPQVYLGASLRPVVEGRQETLHKNVYVETKFEGVAISGWTVISDRYKYVLYEWGRNREALYDLENDKGETHNLIADPACQEVLKDMRVQLLDWAEIVGNRFCLRNIRQIVKYQ